jgi:hypothetical protein
MSKLEVLRKIIKEEVKLAIREELSPLLKEIKNHIKPNVNSAYTKTLKEEFTQPKKNITRGNSSILDILNETKESMVGDEYKTMINANSSMAQGFPLMGNNRIIPPVVENVNQMIANATPTTDINKVQIDTVPDFSALMNKMKTNNQI